MKKLPSDLLYSIASYSSNSVTILILDATCRRLRNALFQNESAIDLLSTQFGIEQSRLTLDDIKDMIKFHESRVMVPIINT